VQTRGYLMDLADEFFGQVNGDKCTKNRLHLLKIA
jgi:hypothetical protein